MCWRSEPTEHQKAETIYTNFSDTDRAKIDQYAATTHMLVKIEGGAKIGI